MFIYVVDVYWVCMGEKLKIVMGLVCLGLMLGFFVYGFCKNVLCMFYVFEVMEVLDG